MTYSFLSYRPLATVPIYSFLLYRPLATVPIYSFIHTVSDGSDILILVVQTISDGSDILILVVQTISDGSDIISSHRPPEVVPTRMQACQTNYRFNRTGHLKWIQLTHMHFIVGAFSFIRAFIMKLIILLVSYGIVP